MSLNNIVRDVYGIDDPSHVFASNLLYEIPFDADADISRLRTYLSIFRGDEVQTQLSQFLLDNRKFDDEDQDPPGAWETPLFMAARNGHAACCRALLEAGANVDLGTSEHSAEKKAGMSPLHVASFLGYASCVDVLLDGGAGIEVRDAMGRRALDWALWGGRLAIVGKFITAGSVLDVCAFQVAAMDDSSGYWIDADGHVRRRDTPARRLVKRRMFCAMLRAGGSFHDEYHCLEPGIQAYLEKIEAAGGFAVYAAARQNELVTARLLARSGPLPEVLVPLIVEYLARPASGDDASASSSDVILAPA